MGKITIDELSNELKERINELGLTEEQVQQLIDNTSGDKSQLQTNAKGSLVDAINELFQSANNGKELIATAIGEPLNSSDTFSAMSTNINGLLSTFKTNMMNNGVSVTGSDKFKQLIDKLATLADSEGKGIKYANGTLNNIQLNNVSNNISLNLGIDFTPTLLVINIDGFITGNLTYTGKTTINNLIHNSSSNICMLFGGLTSALEADYAVGYAYITSSNNLYVYNRYTGSGNSGDVYLTGISWEAVGVGEEDTTLRDSLASILEDEGVSVVPEDDMASLITKVDEEFDRKNANTGIDIISATELPVTGKENQICVITDNPVDEYMIYQFEDDMPADYTGIGIMLSNVQSTTNVTINGNPGFKMHILSIKQNNESMDSYIYTNGTWNPLTISKYILLANGVRYYEDKFGYFDGSKSKSCTWESNKGYFVNCLLIGSYACAQNNKLIDFSKYSKITITLTDKSSSVTSVFEGDNAYLACVDSNGKDIKEINFFRNGTYTLDISNVNASGYISIGDSAILANAGSTRFLITYICIE